ncbi:hypothetical protein SAMN05216567_115133 [Variovorax sp. OK605]|uniref:hypothetical protein n=1 Tax=Variovorax sp. OK605 TaxID=1855317 RepID=UPI0008EC6148|nr:hypothetical protein [Variovorax sp. OK605]SFQ41146.1 hypothetical protein SAMN05216567_115133 [Variovorax sp. OK605]
MHFFKHCLPAGLALAFALAATATTTATTAPAPVLLVTSPAALQAAEKSGAGFARWFGETPGADGIATNQALMRSPAWRAVTEPIGASLAGIQRRDKQAGVGISKYPHRLFDARWLASPDAYFELVGVANRMDRRPFQEKDGACGETRLVYRLAYRTPAMQSRLPMTVNVELRGDAPNANGSCAEAAKRWQPPQASMSDEATGRWLVSADGPLAPQRLAPARISQVTTNLQSVRWPSAVRPDLGGHAEYMLRAFRWNASAKSFDVGPLENTPDVAKLKADAPLRKELQQWLQQPANLRALDEATLQIPEKFLATESISVAPRGLERLANQPFAQVFAPGEWKAVEGSRTLASPQAVLRRLDDLSCAGCHQSRAVAGFHLLGVDRRGASRTFTTGNALAVPHSPHVQDELARRAIYVRAALSTPRPDPFRPLAEPGEPDEPDAAPGKATVGARCEPTRITQSANPWLDRAQKQPRIACEGAASVCETTSVGFPGGMCSGPCDPADKNGTCGGIAILSDFNSCLAAKKPFGECLARHSRPGNLRSCSAGQACRDDYICAQADGQPEGHGACIPPYFLFQMRVDGHS